MPDLGSAPPPGPERDKWFVARDLTQEARAACLQGKVSDRDTLITNFNASLPQ